MSVESYLQTEVEKDPNVSFLLLASDAAIRFGITFSDAIDQLALIVAQHGGLI